MAMFPVLFIFAHLGMVTDNSGRTALHFQIDIGYVTYACVLAPMRACAALLHMDAALAVASDRMCAFGGQDTVGNSASVECFDFSQGSWSAIASMNISRAGGPGVLDNLNGRH